jgi:hypothetical protein
LRDCAIILAKGVIDIMEKIFQNYAVIDIEERKKSNLQLEKRIKEMKLLKEKLEKHFNFEIPDYIIDDILDYEKYHHICLIINLAVVSNRLSEENGKILKEGIKKLFNIDNDYDIVRKEVYMNSFNYEEWSKKYHNEEFIDLIKSLNDNDIIILNKLGIEVKDKIYTNYEFDLIEGELLRYYRNEDEMDEEELKFCKSLEGTGVKREEYNNVLEKFNKISEEYNI